MKKLALIFLVLFVTSCTSTKGVAVHEKKDGWFNAIRVGDYIFLPNPLSFLNPFVDRGFYYCKANDNDGTPLANPICYKVKYSSYNDEKSKYDREKDYEVKLKEKK
ncbi:MAG: hypothetical protein ACKO47_02185 [Alphaproteobacteria bacterium]